jgi:hypothetical protein
MYCWMLSPRTRTFFCLLYIDLFIDFLRRFSPKWIECVLFDHRMCSLHWFSAQILSKMDRVLNALGQNPPAGSCSSIVNGEGIEVKVNSEERRTGNNSHCSSFSSRKPSDSSRQTAHPTHTNTRHTHRSPLQSPHTFTPQQLAYLSDSD